MSHQHYNPEKENYVPDDYWERHDNDPPSRHSVGFEEVICNHCNGSGEGMHDGSSCGHCGGSGVEWADIEEDEDEDGES